MKKIVLSILVSIMLFTSCDKFDVVNENPDVALNISKKPELLLTQVERNAIRRAVSDSWSEGNLMGQYGARIVFTSFDLFDWGAQTGTWNTYFSKISDLKNLEKIAVDNNLATYQAVSKILQVWMFSILTDMWGDIPYSEVAQSVDGNYTPKYDLQKDMYADMLNQLKQANTLLTENSGRVNGDLLFDGDLMKWRKFANSLRLRLALRLSNVEPNTSESVIKEVFSNASQYPIMDSNADNAALKFLSSNPNAHPITEESVYRVGSFNEYRIAEQFVNLLEKFDDPRLQFFADPTAKSVENNNPEIVGMLNGIVDGPAYEYKGGDAFLSKFAIDYFYLQPNTNEARLMTYSEVQFILAEAAQRGWITGTAKDFYDEGIKSNFSYWGVNLPSNYLGSTPVAYNNTIERIIEQKYIALFYTDYQGFLEYKRTGFPSTITPGPDAFYSTYPSRFEYPGKEEALNKANFDEAVSRLSNGNEITSKVWWEN